MPPCCCSAPLSCGTACPLASGLLSHVSINRAPELACPTTALHLLLTHVLYRLMRRAVQTLWKPVPELIGILGVDVPDAPDVMLAGIGVDKATVNWARPQPNKPVQKFLIQVNGVVGKP